MENMQQTQPSIGEARPWAPASGGLGSCGGGALRAVGGLPCMFLGSRDLSSTMPASPVGRVGNGLWDGLAWPTGSGGTVPPLPGTRGPPTAGSRPPLLRAGSSSASGGRDGLAENELESGVGEPDQGIISDLGEVGRDGRAEVQQPDRGQRPNDGSEEVDPLSSRDVSAHGPGEVVDEETGGRDGGCHAGSTK